MNISSVVKRFVPAIVPYTPLSMGNSSRFLGESLPRRLTLLLKACSDSTLLRQACVTLKNFRGIEFLGEAVSSLGMDCNEFVASSLIKAYLEYGKIDVASKLFDKVSQKDCVIWNVMLNGYAKYGALDTVIKGFSAMRMDKVYPNSVTFDCVLSVCSSNSLIDLGVQIHGLVVVSGLDFEDDVWFRYSHMELHDIWLCSEWIDGRKLIIFLEDGIFRDISTAQKIFSQCNSVDIVVFTAMISGYLHNFLNINALEMFRQLVDIKMSPNEITLVSILPVIGGLLALKLGRELHGFIIKKGFDKRCNIGCAVIDMYGKCGRMDLAYEIFGRISEKDIVLWNSMITRCAQSDNPGMAIDLFRQMGVSKIGFDCISISSVLSACANLPSESFGKVIHCFMIKHSSFSDVYSESTLLDMYGKCGNLKSAMNVFKKMKEKNIVSWNSIISAFGNHGKLEESLCLFNEMVENSGIHPDEITFLEVISSCCHVGDVEKGVRFFRSMAEDYGIKPQMEHYACVVDLFGRSGLLKEAYETVKNMPVCPDVGVWGTLLSSCRIHKNHDLAKVVSSKLMDLDLGNSGYYVLISNSYANAGEWGSVVNVRSLMKEKGVEKIPGSSWIEINDKTVSFVSGGGNSEICSLLDLVLEELKLEGFVPQPYLQMHPELSRKLNLA